jgi:aminoglycoside phosphotransferase (APT) family kinase protein
LTTSGELIATGSRSTVHTYGPDAVAKVPFPTTPDGWIRSEAVYTAAVHAVGAPAPRLLGVVEEHGRAVSVYERVNGPSMWEYLIEHPNEAAAMGRLLAGLHHDIIKLPPPVALPRQRDRLACKIRRAAATVDIGLLGALELIPPDIGPPHLCHGDMHPANVILAADGPIVVDWFDACLGDPAGDVARSSLLVGASGATISSIGHLPGAEYEMLRSLHDSYVETMFAHLGLDLPAFATWRRIEAAARLAEGLTATELLAIWQRR